MNSYFVLRALAAQEMPHEREISCRCAAGEPDIHADFSEDERSNSQFAGRNCRSILRAEGLLYALRDSGEKRHGRKADHRYTNANVRTIAFLRSASVAQILRF